MTHADGDSVRGKAGLPDAHQEVAVVELTRGKGRIEAADSLRTGAGHQGTERREAGVAILQLSTRDPAELRMRFQDVPHGVQIAGDDHHAVFEEMDIRVIAREKPAKARVVRTHEAASRGRV